jgi:peptide/nickel transport system substrate-binding protein
MASKLSRRKFLQASAAATGSALLASTQLGALSTVWAQDEEPVRGGTLTISGAVAPQNMYIPQRMNTFGVLQQIDSMFLRLVYGKAWSEGMEPPASAPVELGVAETMTEIEPNRVWEFTLRENVRWHDGQPVTAADVIFGAWMSLNRNLPGEISAPKPNSVLGSGRLLEEGSDTVGVEGITKLGDYAVRVELDRPTPGYWTQFYNAIYPMPQHVLADNPAKAFEPPFGTMPLGNGAFKPVRYVDEQYIELEANDDFYLGRPNIDRLIFRVFPAGDGMWLALEAGEVDGLFAGIPNDNYRRFTQLPTVEGVLMPMASPHGFKINASRFPDQYVGLHQAALYAIDVPFLSNTYYGGALNPHNYNFIHSYGLETPPAGYPTYSYNPDRAREVLASINWDENRVLDWLVWFEPFEFHEAIAAMLSEAGIQTQFVRVDGAAISKALYEDSDFDFIYTSSYGGSDMRQMWDQFRCGATTQNGGSNNNGYCNPELDALWEEALNETDEALWKEKFNQVALMLGENPPMATWMSPNVAHVWNRRVRGAHPFQHFQPIRPALERVWLAPA